MTCIEQMIQDMCPNGVEFKTLGELGVFENTGVDKKSREDEQEVTLLNFMDVCRHKYIDASVPTMVVTAPEKKITQCNVLKDDIFITPSSETIDEIGFAAVILMDLPNVVYSYHIMRYRLNNPNTTTAKFIRYLFEAPVIRKQILKSAKGLTRFGLSKYQFAELSIPFPPFEIQKKIVECLDNFSALAAELQAELQARRKQYEYYRTHLLTPTSESNSADNNDGCNWEWKTLGEIGEMIKGSGILKSDFVEEGMPCIHYGQVHTYYGTFAYKTKSFVSEQLYAKCKKAHTGDLVIATTSEDVEACCKATAWLGDEDVAVSGDAHIFRHNQNPKYIAYLFQTEMFAQQKRKCAIGAKVTRVHGEDMLKFRFPFPPLSEQERIVNILDKFEALTTSLSEGIPAEQRAQQQRYEYYRDLLLNFK